MKTEKIHPKHLSLLQVKTELRSQLEFYPKCLPEHSLQIDLLITILMEYAHFNQWSLKKELLKNHNFWCWS